MTRRLTRGVMQVLAFSRKEMIDVMHQPRLLLTLVIGPFLIMAIFGLGYSDTPPALRAAVVAPEDSVFLDRIDFEAGQLGAAVDLVLTTSDHDEAMSMLRGGGVDLIVTFPDDPLGTVLEGERAVVSIEHTRLDPIERTAIGFATDLAVDEVNSKILSMIVGQGQDVARPADIAVGTAQRAMQVLDDAAAGSDTAAWATAVDDANEAIDDLEESLRTSATVESELSVDGDGSTVSAALADIRSVIDDLDRTVPPSTDMVDRISGLRDTTDLVADRFGALTAVDPEVLVRPLAGEVRVAVPGVDRITDWYAPAAVILMLQQFGIAFGALAFVRERLLGIHVVLRVAPVGATATVLGKYIAYLVVGGAIGAILTTAVVTLLDVPLAGSTGDLAIVMALLLTASIGLGLVISLASASDAQAVQYTMIVLLASLFFSGFFLSVGQMEGVARVVSWLLPVTYGMRMLRDVMLRGASPDTWSLVGLAGYSAVTFVVALLGARRSIATTGTGWRDRRRAASGPDSSDDVGPGRAQPATGIDTPTPPMVSAP